MTIALDRDVVVASTSAESRPVALPIIRRKGIAWHGGIGEEPLTIELTFENPASLPSANTRARIDVADFGAFLPWRPLTVISVPSIPPGGRVDVTATVDTSPPRERRAPPRGGLLTGLSRLFQRQERGLQPAHFVGNLNVYVTRSNPVERHLERAVGLQAGKQNLAIFVVGDGSADIYTFHLEAEKGWKVDLDPIPWNTPVHGGFFRVDACIVPPAEVQEGRVAVWVHRASTAHAVPVEFELMARAPGAACYRI